MSKFTDLEKKLENIKLEKFKITEDEQANIKGGYIGVNFTGNCFFPDSITIGK